MLYRMPTKTVNNFESEIFSHKKPISRKLAYLFLLMTVLLLFIEYIVARRDDINCLITLLIVGGVSALLFVVRNMIDKLWDIVILLWALALYGFSLYMSNRERNENSSDKSEDILYFKGYGHSLFQTLTLVHFFYFKYALVFNFSAMIMKIPLLLRVETAYMVNVLILDLCILYTLFLREINENNLLKKFVAYREEFLKFKHLLAEYLPDNLLVLSQSLGKALFFNDAYQKAFDFDPINDDAIEGLEAIIIESHQLDKEPKLQSFSIIFEGDCDLRMLLENIVKEDILGEHFLSFTGALEKNGNRRVFDIKVFSILWDSEKAVAILMSETTQKEAMIALKIADMNKDKVIATVSHELRTPVNAMLGTVQIMEKQIRDPQLQSNLKMFKNSSQILLSIINSMLDLHKIRSKKFKLNISMINLRDFLNEIRALFELQCNQKSLFLRLDLGPNLPEVIKTDKNRLSQILINLIGNALKFTLEGGITIGVKNDPEDSELLVFSVADTGLGIKEKDQAKLFKMFGKLEDPESINTEGVGLGLTISNNLVNILNKNKAGIMLNSIPNKGSTFTFQIVADLKKFEKLETHNFNMDSVLEDSLLVDRKMLFYTDAQSPVKSMKDVITSTNINENMSASRKRSGYPSMLITRDDSVRMLSPRNSTLLCSRRASVGGLILIVDDNIFNLQVAKQLVEEQGFQVKTAYNGEEAISVALKHESQGQRFKMIFMDCQMPVMDGFEATKKLKELMRSGQIGECPILALSANDGEEDKIKCKESGMDEHISKPLREDTLRRILYKYAY